MRLLNEPNPNLYFPHLLCFFSMGMYFVFTVGLIKTKTKHHLPNLLFCATYIYTRTVALFRFWWLYDMERSSKRCDKLHRSIATGLKILAGKGIYIKMYMHTIHVYRLVDNKPADKKAEFTTMDATARIRAMTWCVDDDRELMLGEYIQPILLHNCVYSLWGDSGWAAKMQARTTIIMRIANFGL